MGKTAAIIVMGRTVMPPGGQPRAASSVVVRLPAPDSHPDCRLPPSSIPIARSPDCRSSSFVPTADCPLPSRLPAPGCRLPPSSIPTARSPDLPSRPPDRPTAVRRRSSRLPTAHCRPVCQLPTADCLCPPSATLLNPRRVRDPSPRESPIETGRRVRRWQEATSRARHPASLCIP